jgi:hypothetical protein
LQALQDIHIRWQGVQFRIGPALLDAYLLQLSHFVLTVAHVAAKSSISPAKPKRFFST